MAVRIHMSGGIYPINANFSPCAQPSTTQSQSQKVKVGEGYIVAAYIYRLVLEYYCWYTANIVTRSVFNALSFGGGLVAAVLLCMKQLRLRQLSILDFRYR